MDTTNQTALEAEVVKSPSNWLTRLADKMQNDFFCVVFTGLLGAAISFTIAVIYTPAPKVHDEFANLLAADTFAHGRIANATHPYWEHFETFHVIHQPSYVSKYPPGQAITLAVGQLLGHPIIGVCLTTGLSMSALVWMLVGWLPRKANMFTSLVVATHPGLQLLWGQTYMGGAMAMIGGSLLLGSFIRLTRDLEIRYAVLAAMGITVLAITRPLEGAVMTICVFMLLAWKLWSFTGIKLGQILVRVVLPVAIVGLISGSLWLGYNSKTTGDPLVMPYQIHEETYALTPLFPWQHPATPRSYRHAILQKFYESDFETARQNYATIGAILYNKFDTAIRLGLFFLGCSLVIGLAGIPLLMRDSKIQWAIAILIPSLLSCFLTPWGHTHYVAPVAPLIFLIAIGGLIELWNIREKFAIIRRWNWRTVIALQAIWFVIFSTRVTFEELHGWNVQRRQLEQQLVESPGKDLVFVHYSENHLTHSEWVYNGADIDGSQVVWAREMSPAEDTELMDYFGERRVWVVSPDEKPVVLSPYHVDNVLQGLP